MPMCTVNAAATPAQTQDGRYRVPSTSEANIDLSGSSARNVSVNAIAITARYGMRVLRSLVQRPRIREASSAGRLLNSRRSRPPQAVARWPGATTRRYVGQPAKDYSPSWAAYRLSVRAVAASGQLGNAGLG